MYYRYLYTTIYHYVYIYICEYYIFIYMYSLICSCCLFSSGVHGPWAKAPTPQPTQQTVVFVGSPLRSSCAWNSSTKHSPSASGSPKSLASVERQTGSWNGMGWALHHTSTIFHREFWCGEPTAITPYHPQFGLFWNYILFSVDFSG